MKQRQAYCKHPREDVNTHQSLCHRSLCAISRCSHNQLIHMYKISYSSSLNCQANFRIFQDFIEHLAYALSLEWISRVNNNTQLFIEKLLHATFMLSTSLHPQKEELRGMCFYQETEAYGGEVICPRSWRKWVGIRIWILLWFQTHSKLMLPSIMLPSSSFGILIICHNLAHALFSSFWKFPTWIILLPF